MVRNIDKNIVRGDCENPDAEHHKSHKAKYECEDCGLLYCDSCARGVDYECVCHDPPHLRLINTKKRVVGKEDRR